MKVKRNLLLCSWLSFFLLISVLPGNASVFAQQEKLALSSTQLTVREIFDAISSQLRYDVFYNGEQLDLNRKVKFAQQVLNLEQVLDAVANNRFKYTLEDRTIILTPLTTPQTVNSVTLTGQVTDQSNTPLPGVTVLVKGTKLGTSTDPEGNFKLSLPQQENTILIFSFIGMESQEVPVGDPKKPIKVILKETAENLKEVVVTGIFTRKKESFTGSASRTCADKHQRHKNRLGERRPHVEVGSGISGGGDDRTDLEKGIPQRVPGICVKRTYIIGNHSDRSKDQKEIPAHFLDAECILDSAR